MKMSIGHKNFKSADVCR